MTHVCGDSLFICGSDVCNDKTFVKSDIATDFVHDFQGHGNSFLNRKGR